MPAPLKVLVVHNDYQVPGGETAAVEAEVRLLESRGHSVIRYSRHNDDIRDFGALDKVAFIPAAIYSRRTYRELRDLVATERPDVAHVHNVFPLVSPSAYRALHDAGVPIVQTAHNFRFLCPNGLFYTQGALCERCRDGNTLHAVGRRCVRDSFAVSAIYATALAVHRRAGTFRLIDRLITPAAFAAAKMVEAGFIEPARITVLDYFLPGGLPDPKSSPTDDPFFLYIGRISDEKGIRTLIDAMRQCTAARLALAGTGPMETEVRTGLDRWGLTNVELCGFVEGPRKAALLTRALAVVAPSHCYDMSPLSVVESFAAGTPVVAPRLGNFPVAIGDTERGLLFDPGDAADLAAKLGWLLDHADRAHAMGRNARAFAETHYAEGEHYRRLLAIYEQAAA